MPVRHSHCSYCGNAFTADLPWPRRCAGCEQVSYLNPVPVAVAVLPVGDALLGVRRIIPPGAGRVALPGGFIDFGEAWQDAVVRELWEETGVRADARDVSLYDTLSAPDGTLLVFGLLPRREPVDLPPSAANAESAGWELVTPATPLAFSLHTAVAARYFAGTPESGPAQAAA
ncbi:NUDIX domain-containing protein [Catellatospora sp. KI3]|uniref:NUDIX domain-containing protein n=1 Tax=Catellatospora sp. KI3 TaxID=3041620 RepID=UPI002482AE70|nr:NUDIX domain-containing protein [Catellatospora sp. KI3]MDI1464071.1 NUDIX domain-containing protein [Catellatospora sp. KI3]